MEAKILGRKALYWAAMLFFTFLAATGMVMMLYLLGLIVAYLFGPEWLLEWLRVEVRNKDIFMLGAILTLPGLALQFALARHRMRRLSHHFNVIKRKV